MTIRTVLLGLVSAAVLLCGGCQNSPRLTQNPANQIEVVSSLAPPNPADAAAAAASRGYAIGPFDQLIVRVIGYDGYDTETQVDTAGHIQLPLVGSIVAAGKTPAQLSQDLDEAYGRTYLKKPTVSVVVKEIKSQYVTVDGAVRTPGVFPVVGPMRLSGAIALAQGTNEFAQLSNVAVFRVINGKQHAALFNLRDIRKGLYEEPEIYANDTIIVGDSQVRRVFRDVIQTAPFVAVFRPFG